MNMKTFKFTAFVFCMAMFAMGVFADAKSEAHARRKARRNSVAAIVKSGGASEGVNGYLIP